MRSRAATALVGLAGSLAVSAAVYYYTGWLFAFLVVPFVPLLFRGLRDEGEDGPTGPEFRECPRCGFRTTEPYGYCPHDGARLEDSG